MDMNKIINTLSSYVPFLLSNFDVVMFALAVIFIIFHRIIKRNISESEIVYRWIAFFALGLTLIYTFVMHVFYSEKAAAAIGWKTSPFQFEVGIADLAIGVLGVLSFRASYGFRLATVIAAVIFLWGDAVGHVYQMIQNNNYSIGNAGSWFLFDIVIPIILIICIVNLRPSKVRAQ